MGGVMYGDAATARVRTPVPIGAAHAAMQIRTAAIANSLDRSRRGWTTLAALSHAVERGVMKVTRQSAAACGACAAGANSRDFISRTVVPVSVGSEAKEDTMRYKRHHSPKRRPPLSVTGDLVLPVDILDWEWELLAQILEALTTPSRALARVEAGREKV
jgi:hypothetical protein